MRCRLTSAFLATHWKVINHSLQGRTQSRLNGRLSNRCSTMFRQYIYMSETLGGAWKRTNLPLRRVGGSTRQRPTMKYGARNETFGPQSDCVSDGRGQHA